MIKKRIFTVCLCLAVLVTLGLVISGVIHYLNQPRLGTIENPKITQTPIADSFSLTPFLVSGNYASFTYPGALTSEPASKIVYPEVASYSYSYNDVQPWNLAITILNISGGKLSDNNAYQLRKINPSVYSETNLNINGLSVPIMTDKTAAGFSKVAFLVHNNYQATVSLTGNDFNGLSDLQSTLSQVLSSWRWTRN